MARPPARPNRQAPAVAETLSQPSIDRRRRQAERRHAEFLKGPIPLDWLCRAAGLGGKALPVALAVWFRHGCGERPTIRLAPALLKRFRVGRKAAYKALDALEGAGLLEVDRHRGRAPGVTILFSRSEHTTAFQPCGKLSRFDSFDVTSKNERGRLIPGKGPGGLTDDPPGSVSSDIGKGPSNGNHLQAELHENRPGDRRKDEA